MVAPKDDFERQVLMTLRGPLLFEGLLNDKIDLTPEEWSMLIDTTYTGSKHEDNMMSTIGRLRTLLQRARRNRATKAQSHDVVDELWHCHDVLKGVVAGQKERLLGYEALFVDDATKPVEGIVHAALQAAYGIGMVVAIVGNTILRALDPEDTLLIVESTQMAVDTLALADAASRYRPLGSGYIALCLGAAWVGVIDEDLKAKLEAKWMEWGPDFIGGLDKVPIREMNWTQRQLLLLDIQTESTEIT